MSCACCRIAIFGAACVLCLGCSDSSPSPKMPPLDPAAIAQEAMRRYDSNGDGKLDAKELAVAPALSAMLRTIKGHDPGHADALTADDIAARVAAWKQGIGVLFGARSRVTLDGKRLADAVVTWEPESYLGPDYHPSSGTTNKNGYAYVSPAVEGFQGIFPGLYTVRISKQVEGKETLPACCNQKSTLGREVATDMYDGEHFTNFDLKSK